MARQCMFVSRGVACTRDARKGDTMCARHHSAGISAKHYRQVQVKRKEKRKGR